ncbi:MAG: DUF2157 domain-containing protein [Verrucomicrobiae bacterium]|nr:DUF2157 domain-containing protein [Verrucomicrobiae bacterium]
MSKKSLPRLLETHLRLWQEKQVIDEALSNRLREVSEEVIQRKHSNIVLRAFLVLGGMLILAGLSLLIVENWEAIPRLVKIVLWLLIELGFFWGYWRQSGASQNFLWKEVFALLSTSWIMAGIALMGQVYQLHSRPADGVWLWVTLILPALWLMPAQMTQWVFTIALGIALWTESFDSHSWLGSHIENFVLTGFSIPIIASALAVILVGKGLSSLRGLLSVWILVGGSILLLILGCLDRHLDKFLNYDFVSFVFAFLAVGALYWKPHDLMSPYLGTKSIRIMVGLIWGLLVLGSCLDLLSDYQVVVPLSIIRFLSWVVQFVIALLLVREGSLSYSVGWINLGYLGILAGILVRYFDFFSDLLSGGFSLILTGILILFLMYVLNRGRQRALRRIKEAA